METNFDLFKYITDNFIIGDCNNTKYPIPSMYLIKIMYIYKCYYNQHELEFCINEYFNIFHNIKFNFKDIITITNLVDKNCKNNTKIDINQFLCKIKDICDYENYYDFCQDSRLKYLNNYSELRCIDFQYNRAIKDNMICNLRKLEILRLPKNKFITDKGIRGMGDTLTELDLSANKNITNCGLKNLVHLQHLKLLHNKNISDDAFEKMTKLSSVNLGYNNRRDLQLNWVKMNPNLNEIILYVKSNISKEIIEKIKNMNCNNILCKQLDIFYS